MQVLTAKTVEELKGILDKVPSECLYRGQTKHFGGVNSPAVISSFDRLGCIPSEMGRWAYYASGALKFVLGRAVDSLAFKQAILQHYGWRSFFLDASSSAHVGAWFAAHTYKGDMAIHMSEDCFERGMFLRKPRARYELESGTGHLYVIDKSAAAKAGVGLHDLSAIEIANARPRFKAQAAWLLGPQRGKLPIECFHTRVIANRKIFAEFAAEGGFCSTPDLFPTRAEDPVLYALLNLPWRELELPSDPQDMAPLLAFRRTIEFPEYDDGFTKIYGEEHAFYRGAMLGDLADAETDAPNFVFRHVPEIVMFGVANPVAKRFPRVTEALQATPNVAFEIKQLIRFPETGPSSTYGKGLAVQLKDGGLIEVSDIAVDHPGMEMVGGGVNCGWHYRVAEDGEWIRTAHADDCPCGDDDRHLRHLSALTILEHWLGSPGEFDKQF